ncbi:MAG: hypothetical protein M1836_006417 [Candelina mexicana]|nr:MAG: hypothetical protein M1836_006417 [Candelina mexicana]
MATEVEERRITPENYRFLEITPPTTPNKERETLGVGASSCVIALDADTCEKIYTWEPEKDLDVESRIYDRLGEHQRIVRRIRTKQKSIVLERLPVALRKRLRDLDKEGIALSREQVLQWAIQMAEGLQHLHDNGVLQADMGCHNMLLDRNDNIKFCDFAGSSIDGEKSSCYYESRATYPFPRGSPEWEAEVTTVGTEIFALGTALFEISTTRPPYHEIENGTRKIEELYVARQFASVEGLLMGSIINKCWNDGYGEVKEVLIDLRALEQDGYASRDPQEVTANGIDRSRKAFSDEKVVAGTADHASVALKLVWNSMAAGALVLRQALLVFTRYRARR